MPSPPLSLSPPLLDPSRDEHTKSGSYQRLAGPSSAVDLQIDGPDRPTALLSAVKREIASLPLMGWAATWPVECGPWTMGRMTWAEYRGPAVIQFPAVSDAIRPLDFMIPIGIGIAPLRNPYIFAGSPPLSPPTTMARMKKKGALSRLRTATSRAATVARRKGVVVVGRAGDCGGGGEDRISDLPDDLLRLVLRRLDTRTALATGALSRRWASLCRGLNALDFLVSDVLPPRYHRCRDHLLLHHPHATKGIDADDAKVVAGRYERLSMRKMVASIDSFLDAAPDDDDPDRRRRITRLRLEFIINHHSDSINRLIATAIDAWGVKDLEILAGTPAHQLRPLDRLHIFPHQGICSDPRSSTLTSLTLANCTIPPLQGFQALRILVLQHLPSSTRPADYESVFTSCTQLRVLHLKSCMFDGVLRVNAPCSSIEQLVFDHCGGGLIILYALPKLEEMAVVQTCVWFQRGSMPCLKRLNLIFRYKHDHHSTSMPWGMNLMQIAEYTPEITELFLEFTGRGAATMDAPPSSPLPSLPNLRKLVVVVPSSWDVSWPRLLLEVAPCLEILHVHVAACEDEPRGEISWRRCESRHRKLKELGMSGFEGTGRQVYFVNFVMEVSLALKSVSLCKYAGVYWDYDIVREDRRWSSEDRADVLKQIGERVSCTDIPVQLVRE